MLRPSRSVSCTLDQTQSRVEEPKTIAMSKEKPSACRCQVTAATRASSLTRAYLTKMPPVKTFVTVA